MRIAIVYELAGKPPASMVSTAFQSLKHAMRTATEMMPGGKQEWGGMGVASYLRPDGSKITFALLEEVPA